MHAIVGEVEIDASRSDEARRLLHDVAIPAMRTKDGYVHGYWLRSEDGTRGRAMVFFKTEQAARAARDNAPIPPDGAPVKFVGADIYEVLEQA